MTFDALTELLRGTTSDDFLLRPQYSVIARQQRSVKVPFKVLRGMASIEAIRDRPDVEDDEVVDLESIGAEGTEVSVPARIR